MPVRKCVCGVLRDSPSSVFEYVGADSAQAKACGYLDVKRSRSLQAGMCLAPEIIHRSPILAVFVYFRVILNRVQDDAKSKKEARRSASFIPQVMNRSWYNHTTEHLLCEYLPLSAFARGGAFRAEKTPCEPFLLIRGKYPEGGMGVEISLVREPATKREGKTIRLHRQRRNSHHKQH